MRTLQRQETREAGFNAHARVGLRVDGSEMRAKACIEHKRFSIFRTGVVTSREYGSEQGTKNFRIKSLANKLVTTDDDEEGFKYCVIVFSN